MDAHQPGGPDEEFELMFDGPDDDPAVFPANDEPTAEPLPALATLPPVAAAEPVDPVAALAAEAEAAPPRKPRSRKAKPVEAAEEPAPPPDPVPEPPAPAAPEPAPPPAPAAVPVAPATPRYILAALALSLVSSGLSAGGLILAGRAAAHAEAAVAEAEDRQARLARVPHLVDELERVTTDASAALARIRAATPQGVATAADLRREIDGLKLVVAAKETPGLHRIAEQVGDGQSEIARRLDTLADRLDRTTGR